MTNEIVEIVVLNILFFGAIIFVSKFIESAFNDYMEFMTNDFYTQQSTKHGV